MDNIYELAEDMGKLRSAFLLYTPYKEYQREHENTEKSDMKTFFKVWHALKAIKKYATQLDLLISVRLTILWTYLIMIYI